jgi:FAD/FMN-containing dehydrogenase
MTDPPILRRAEDGYEQARQAAIWNGKKPDRFPDAIVVARDEADVVAAVRLANAEGWTIGIRSGGHAWSATGIRDGGLLLDLSSLDRWEIDPAARTAAVGPGARSQAFSRALGEHGLYFPTGTCSTVGVGGYTIGGGASFTGCMDGPACYRLTAIDAVTAEGELIHADDESHPDLMWAARGSGPGFFAAVTRLHLEVSPLPAAMRTSLYVYPVDVLGEFLEWILPVTLAAPENVANLWAAIESFLPFHQGTIIAHFPIAFADTDEEADALLEPFERSPILDRALVHQPPHPWTWDDGYAQVDQLYPKGFRYRSDALWVNAEDDAFLEPLDRIIRSLPTSHSHVLWAPWKTREHPNAAYSLHTPLSVHVYGVGEEQHEDEPLDTFVRDAMRSLEPYSIRGGKVNDHDLVSFPKYVLGPEETERLKELKATYDPEGRFHSYLGTPEPVAS